MKHENKNIKKIFLDFVNNQDLPHPSLNPAIELRESILKEKYEEKQKELEEQIDDLKTQINQYISQIHDLNIEKQNLAKKLENSKEINRINPIHKESISKNDNASIQENNNMNEILGSFRNKYIENLGKVDAISIIETNSVISSKIISSRKREDAKKFDNLCEWLISIMKIKEIEKIFEKAENDIPSIMNVKTLTFFIIHPNLKRIFNSPNFSIFKTHSFYLSEGSIDQLFISLNPDKQIPVEPSFASISKLISNVIKSNEICLPVLNHFYSENEKDEFDNFNQVYMAIQLRGKIGTKSTNPFNNSDILMTKMVASAFSLILRTYIREQELEEKASRNERFLTVCSKIYAETNPQIICDLIQNEVPKLYNLDKALLLTYGFQSLNNLEGKFGSDGTRFTSNVVEYASKCGLTGKTLLNKEIMIYHFPTENKNYNSQTDNIFGIEVFKNLIIIPLYDKKGLPNGVIQLGNSKSDFGNDFKKSIQNLKNIVENSLQNSKMFNEACSIIVLIYKIIHDLYNMITNDEREMITENKNIMMKLIEQMDKILDAVNMMEYTKKIKMNIIEPRKIKNSII